MRPESLKWLQDMQQAADLLAQFTDDKSAEDYLGDALLRSAVERQLMIIGEALGNLRREDETLLGGLTEPHRIIALRHILVHGYSVVEDLVIWDIVQVKLPALRQELALLMETE